MMPEDFEKFINNYVININQRSEAEKIKWKGPKMENYRRNWQYAITKEVLIMHEVIEPYDWNLDIQENPDFEIWQQQLEEKKDR